MANFTICELFLVGFDQNGEGRGGVLVSYYTGSSFPEQSYRGKDMATGKESLSNNRALDFKQYLFILNCKIISIS